MKTKKENLVYINNLNIFDNIKNRINNKELGCTILVPHVCNNLGVFGGGFAAQIGDRFPIVKENFCLLGKKTNLGKVQYVKIMQESIYKHSAIIANMIAQNGLIGHNNPRPLNYEYLVKCMCQVRDYINDLKNLNNDNVNIEIHCPKFGSGLAGGNWFFISDLIQDIWKNIPTYVYVLKKNHNG